MSSVRKVSLFRNGRNQAVRIPVEFELPGTEALMRKEGDALIIEPTAAARDWLEALRRLEALNPDERLPVVDDGELPPPHDLAL